jgi:DNA modification methylase
VDSKQIIWQAVDKNIKDLKPFRGNPRRGTKDQKARLETSLDRFGIANPECINLDGTVIGGNFRLLIYKERGIKIIPCMAPSRQLTDEEALELNLRLNHNTGEWDYDILSGFNEALLKDVGFDNLLEFDGDVEATEADDEVPEVLDSITKPGDLWLLGEHRVLCGDSTKSEDVARLMDGQTANMIFTDPPYNVDYGSSKTPRHKIRTIQNDHLDADGWRDFCHSVYTSFETYNNGDIYMWGASCPEGMRARLWLVEMGCHWSATICWKKQQLVLSPANYQRMYEPCFYGWFRKSSYNGDRTQTEVWEIDRPLNSKLHPTMKPIDLCCRGIINSSKPQDIVLDLFLGSGSTLIAADKTKRICYGMEIDPHYCDVIVARWEQATGLKATLEGSYDNQ